MGMVPFSKFRAISLKVSIWSLVAVVMSFLCIADFELASNRRNVACSCSLAMIK